MISPSTDHNIVLSLSATQTPDCTSGVHQALPLPLTSLVGRDSELAAVRGLILRSDVRLVTLAGPGGVGKTRLALAVAADLRSEFFDGVRLVELAAIRHCALVVPAIAQALGVFESGPQTALAGLVTALGTRHLLLVLDNAEHVLEVGPVIVQLLARCPNLKVLVTSRTPLQVSGEHLFPVSPLGLPKTRTFTPSDLFVDSPAVALFVQRVQQVQPSFALTEDNAAHVVAVCRRLDGLPLAIELAAVRMRVLSLEQLLERLQSRLQLLTDGARDHHPRHHTMRDTIAWSYALLTPADQALFRCLAVFVDGFTVESADAVLMDQECVLGAKGGGATPAPMSGEPISFNLFERLTALVDSSLLRVVENSEGRLQFGMFETVREFALERLAAAGEAPALNRRHAMHFLSYIEDLKPCFFASCERAALDLVEHEHGNIRAAFGWAVEQREAEIALRFARVLWHLWLVRGYLNEGCSWGERVLALPSSRCEAYPEARGEVRFAVAWIALLQGDVARAAALADEALDVAREDGSEFGTALAMFVRGLIAETIGDSAEAVAWYERALALARRLGYPSLTSYVLVHLGTATKAIGQLDEAQAMLEEALVLRRPTGNKIAISNCLTALGDVAFALGEASRARGLHRDAFALRWQDAYRMGMAESLRKIAALASSGTDAERTVRLLGASEALRMALGAPLSTSDRQDVDRVLNEARRSLGDSRFTAAVSMGRTMSLSRVVVEALAPEVPQTNNADSAVRGLTSREQEVLRLIVAGSSDKEIAEALFISRRTVTSYVTSILTKLDLHSRTAAAAYAVRHGLA